MTTTYEQAIEPAAGILAEVIQRWHRNLSDADVTIDLLAAHAPENAGAEEADQIPALTRGGYAVAAYTRVVALRDRTAGLGDAQIIYDGDAWRHWSPETRLAVLDHELEHLELVRDSEGEVKQDDLGRPRLRIKPHDHQHGWFDAVAQRHGAASLEVQQAQRLMDERGQLYFAFAATGTDGREATPRGAHERRRIEIVVDRIPKDEATASAPAPDGPKQRGRP
jgi:hypothetical protein